jgi:ankyrin repeat protein
VLTSVRQFRVVALHRAIKRNDAAAVRKMIEADHRLLESRNMDSDSGTPLMGSAWTGSADAMLALLNLGADIHTVDQNWGWPIVNWACFWCHGQALAVLIEHGATSEALPEELSGIARNGKERHPTITAADLQSTLDVIERLSTTQPAPATQAKQ